MIRLGIRGKLFVLTINLCCSELTPAATELIDQKLDSEGCWYIPWKESIQLFLDVIGKQDHLRAEPLKDPTKAKWIDDRLLFILIYNTLESEVQDYIVHCNTVKELWELLESIYSKKDHVT